MSIINHRLHRWTSSHPVVVSCSMESQKKIPMDFPKVLPITPTSPQRLFGSWRPRRNPSAPVSHAVQQAMFDFRALSQIRCFKHGSNPRRTVVSRIRQFLETMRLSGPF